MEAIFIGGTGRSGTTIFKHILSQHQQISSLPFEARIIIDPGGALDLIDHLSDCWTPYNADIALYNFLKLTVNCQQTSLLNKVLARLISYVGVTPFRYPGVGIGSAIGQRNYRSQLNTLINALNIRENHGYWGGSVPFQLSKVIYEVGPFARDEVSKMVADFVVGIFSNNATETATHWLDDTPYNFLQAHRLKKIFPKMKLLHIYRDPRDVTASYRTKVWGGRDISVIANRINGILNQWFIIKEGLSDSLYAEFSLEKISEKPRKYLSEICKFLEIPFDERLLNIKLNHVNAGRWLKDLSLKEQSQVNRILSSHINAMGYSRM
ncbi:MAG: sulfotransferase [Candidatus Electrothrix sp. Rat3]|nr:sulfotransferase [Candidatus Electrothrix rattekaaiensis]